MRTANQNLTLIDLSNMFLGFEVVLDLVTDCLPQNLLSIDFSGNQLTSTQINIVKHCLGMKIEGRKTIMREIFINIDSTDEVSLQNGLTSQTRKNLSVVDLINAENSKDYKNANYKL